MPFCRLTKKAPKPKGISYPENPQTLGEFIRRQRIDHGLLQREVAELIGIDSDTLSGWELGRAAPEVRYRPAIYAFLGFCPFDSSWSFGQRLRAAREAQGLSVEHAGRVLGLDSGTIRRAESRDGRISALGIRAVRRILDGPGSESCSRLAPFGAADR